MSLLEVKNLNTTFNIHVGQVKAVRGIDLHLEAGETLGIVGESGSGKSVTMLSVMKLLPDYAKITADKIEFDGEDILNPKYKMSSISGDKIGMVFQDPMTSLNPLYKVGNQLIEPYVIHKKVSKEVARQRVLDVLRLVEMPDPERRLKQYPHELSGGMRQRVMIAMALMCDPKLIIADEPTTALDVTIQAQILDLFRDLRTRLNSSVIMITHDLGVIAGLCDRVMVLYGGLIVEEGTVDEIFYEPRHPYTWGLLKSIPQKSGVKEKLQPIAGSPPDLLAPPAGCPFAPRCQYCMHICDTELPELAPLSETHRCRCHLLDERAPKVEWEGIGL
ncbi:MAG: ABC transporter ATP-binding protein [Firmicutes bacterium]|nr:ABC transporter ATP-binding protein [Bacillota bacterium]